MTDLNGIKVYRRDPKTLNLEELADFKLAQEGALEAKYRNPRFMCDMLEGIWVGPRQYTPEDGIQFLYALQEKYARSSLISLELY